MEQTPSSDKPTDDRVARALEYVERRGLIPSKMHPTDREASEQEYQEKALARTLADFAASESQEWDAKLAKLLGVKV